MDDDLKFKHPFTGITSGPTRSGKSFAIRFLQNLDSLYTEPDFSGGILWCFNENTAFPSKQLVTLKNIRFHEGLPKKFGNAQGKPCLIILDDLLKEVYSKHVCELFTKGSHHRNISVILIIQNLFQQGRY
jgi:hypothetical protein